MCVRAERVIPEQTFVGFNAFNTWSVDICTYISKHDRHMHGSQGHLSRMRKQQQLKENCHLNSTGSADLSNTSASPDQIGVRVLSSSHQVDVSFKTTGEWRREVIQHYRAKEKSERTSLGTGGIKVSPLVGHAVGDSTRIVPVK